jgi:hypothetical protein
VLEFRWPLQTAPGVTQDIQRWSFSSFGSVKAEIKSLRRKLEEAKSRARSEGSNLEIHNIEQKLHEVFEKEEIMYKQRSRQEWLKAGDRNTKKN